MSKLIFDSLSSLRLAIIGFLSFLCVLVGVVVGGDEMEKCNNGRCRSEPLTNLPLPAKGHQVSLAQKFPSRAKHKLIGDNCLFIVKVSQLYQRTYMITGAVRLTPGVLLGPMLSVLHTPPLLSVSGSLSVFTGITFQF